MLAKRHNNRQQFSGCLFSFFFSLLHGGNWLKNPENSRSWDRQLTMMKVKCVECRRVELCPRRLPKKQRLFGEGKKKCVANEIWSAVGHAGDQARCKNARAQRSLRTVMLSSLFSAAEWFDSNGVGLKRCGGEDIIKINYGDESKLNRMGLSTPTASSWVSSWAAVPPRLHEIHLSSAVRAGELVSSAFEAASWTLSDCPREVTSSPCTMRTCYQ